MKKYILIYLLIFCINTSVSAMELSADSACLMIANTGEVIFSKNEKAKKPMASTTKIMTALLALENGNTEDVVTVSKTAERQEGSSLYLRSGEKIKMIDLVYGLMLNSGNDAAVAIAEHISGDVNQFAEKMTQKATEIGAVNTHFKNPNGLDAPEHYTTAYDLALIASYALKNENFYAISSTKSKTASLESGQMLYFNNHNKMLKMYNGAVGVKTGFTKSSGRCLVSAAVRDGILLVAVTLNAPDDWNDHVRMLDYGFENTTLKTVITQGEILKTKTKNDIDYHFIASKSVKIPSFSAASIDIKLHFPENLPAPINKGEKAGVGEILWNGKYIDEFDIVSAENIGEEVNFVKITFLKNIIRVWKSMLV